MAEVQNQTQETPAVESNFPMDQSPDGRLDFAFNDNGELLLALNKAEQGVDENILESVDNSLEVSESAGEVETEPENRVEAPPSQSMPQSNEITALQAQVNQLTTLLSAAMQAQHQPQQQEYDYDFSDPNHVKHFIATTVNQSIQQALAPVQQHQQYSQQQILKMEFENARARHGVDFDSKLPVVVTLMKGDPNLTFDAAYNMIKSSTPTSQRGAATQGKASPAPTRTVSAEQLKAKAEKLKTEAGVSQQSTKPTNFNTLKGALEDAITQVYNSR